MRVKRSLHYWTQSELSSEAIQRFLFSTFAHPWPCSCILLNYTLRKLVLRISYQCLVGLCDYFIPFFFQLAIISNVSLFLLYQNCCSSLCFWSIIKMGGSNSSLRISCKKVYGECIWKIKRAFGAKAMLAVTRKRKMVCHLYNKETRNYFLLYRLFGPVGFFIYEYDCL